MFDEYEIAAIISTYAAQNKNVKPDKVFNRKKAERELFRKEKSIEEMQKEYEKAKKIAEELKRRGGRQG